MDIGYQSEPIEDYQKALNGAKTLDGLRKAVGKFALIAGDAAEVVSGMDEDAFKEWAAGLAMERKKQFAGEDWVEKYGAIVMPIVMLEVGMIAQHFGAPWGCAYIRMKEAGRIKEVCGVAQLVKQLSSRSDTQ